jgi:hypothetical protein
MFRFSHAAEGERSRLWIVTHLNVLDAYNNEKGVTFFILIAQ